MKNTGITHQEWQAITDILKSIPHVEKAVLFGSRAMGLARSGSDVDIMLYGEGLGLKDLIAIKSRLEDTTLPYGFDLVLFEKANEKLLEHERTYGQEIFVRGRGNGWQKVKLGDVCTFQNGYAFKSNFFTTDGAYKVIKIKELKDGLVTFFEDSAKVSVDLNDYTKYTVEKNDVVFALTGDPVSRGNPLSWVGRIAISKENDTCLLNQRLCKAMANEKYLDKLFLYYYFRVFENFYQLASNATGSANQANISTKTLENICIPLPPLEEQKRIAAILSSLDDKIEVNNQINKNLEEQAQALFKSWFVNKTQGDYAILSDYIILNPKITLKKGTIAPAIDMKDLSTTSMSVTAAAEKKTYNGGAKFQNNHTLLARITPCLENGKTAFVDFLDEDEIGFGSTEFIVMQAKESVSSYYVYCLARNDDFRNCAIKSMVGSSGRQRVQVDVLENYPVTKVSENMFIKFTQYVEPMFKEIRKNTLENQCLARIRELLLPRLMNK